MKKIKKTITERLIALLLVWLALGFTACDNDSGNEPPPPPPKTNYLTSVTAEKHFTREEVLVQLNTYLPSFDLAESPIASLVKDVDVAAITYLTTGVDGQPVQASGIIAMPSGTSEYDHLLSIQHVTCDLEKAPSRQLFYPEVAPVITGQVVVMADYLGYGYNQMPDRQDPYLHIASTGRVCADMIEAAREYLHQKNIIERTDQVQLMGYSQGAHASIATLLELEKRGESARVTAVHVGGGIYDVEGTLQHFLTSAVAGIPFPNSGYLPYIIRGMAYGEQLSLEDARIYSSKLIDEGTTKIFSTQPLSEWHAALGADLTVILNPDFFAPAFNGNADIEEVMAALHANSFVNVEAPTSAITFYHSRSDDFVPYFNSEAMHAHCPNSTLIDLVLPGHTLAAVEFMLRYMGLWEMMWPAGK